MRARKRREISAFKIQVFVLVKNPDWVGLSAVDQSLCWAVRWTRVDPLNAAVFDPDPGNVERGRRRSSVEACSSPNRAAPALVALDYAYRG